MSFVTTKDLTKAIIDVLNQFDRPVGVDEISFRTRSTQSMVFDAIAGLIKANVVVKEGNEFRLNPHEEYKLKSLIT